MPELPVHARVHRENFDRNQRIRGMEERTEDVRKKLKRVNQITYQSAQKTRLIADGSN